MAQSVRLSVPSILTAMILVYRKFHIYPHTLSMLTAVLKSWTGVFRSILKAPDQVTSGRTSLHAGVAQLAVFHLVQCHADWLLRELYHLKHPKLSSKTISSLMGRYLPTIIKHYFDVIYRKKVVVTSS